jgi:hypothetical protein
VHLPTQNNSGIPPPLPPGLYSVLVYGGNIANSQTGLNVSTTVYYGGPGIGYTAGGNAMSFVPGDTGPTPYITISNSGGLGVIGGYSALLLQNLSTLQQRIDVNVYFIPLTGILNLPGLPST